MNCQLNYTSEVVGDVVGWAVIVCVCLMKWLGSVLECGAGWRSAHHFTSQQTGQCSFAGLKRALLTAC